MKVLTMAPVSPHKQVHRHWTDAQIAYLDAHVGKVGIKAAAQHLCKTPEAVRMMARRRGLAVPSNRWTAADLAYLDANYGLRSLDEIGGKLGRSSEAVRWKAHELCLRVYEGNELTLAEVSRVLGIHRDTLRKHVANGTLGAAKRKTERTKQQGEYWRFSPEEVRKFIARYPDLVHITDANKRAFMRIAVGAAGRVVS